MNENYEMFCRAIGQSVRVVSDNYKVTLKLNRWIESMIKNVCIAIPFESLYVILDMEWKELDSNLRFVYGCK